MPRKKRPGFRRWSQYRKPGDAHTRLSFCSSNKISESFYFKLKRQGKGPREIELDRRIIITSEAERGGGPRPRPRRWPSVSEKPKRQSASRTAKRPLNRTASPHRFWSARCVGGGNLSR